MGVRFWRLYVRFFGRAPVSRELGVITADGRRFRVTNHGDYGPTLVAHLRPYPTRRERVRHLFGNYLAPS